MVFPMGRPPGAPGGVGMPEGGRPLGRPCKVGWLLLIVVEPVELLGKIMLLTG